jgi:hypothetical protein
MAHVKLIAGDLLTTTADIIAHGVNCRGVMGAGVARAIATRWPTVKTAYLDKYHRDGWSLGETQFLALPGTPSWVVNMATQDGYGRDGCHLDYAALTQSLETLFRFATEGHYTVALPRIGAGLAGGDWNRIWRIIEQRLQLYPDVLLSIYRC